MFLKNTILTSFCLFSVAVFAQDNGSTLVQVPTQSYLEQVKSSFVKDNMASCVDSLWIKELTDLDFFKDIEQDIETVNTDLSIDEELPTELLKQRLAAMNQKSPFKIEYNQGIENVIKSYLKYRRKSFGRLMSLSDYYFPIFEEAFAKQNVPLEIKYLSIVESALNPKAVSRMGATGLWQFMYGTGKQYGLKIDSFIDERADPLKATEAASEYMSKMYTIFGDWDLVLASYNSGPGNVSKAIRRSGGKQSYWEIQKHLPKETQGYVPAFIATMYLYQYHNEHGIIPEKAVVQHFETDTIRIKEKMSFKQISDLLDIPESQIQLLNPSYKLNVVPFYSDEDHYLRLPLDKVAIFTSNEDKIYAYINHEENPQEQKTQLASTSNDNEVVKRIKYYKIKRGDNLGSIADKYDVSVVELKSWNKLRSSVIAAGKTLKIISEEKIIAKPEREVVKSNASIDKKRVEEVVADVTNSKTTNKPTTHIVVAGDNLGNIAKQYGLTVADIKQCNGLKTNDIALGRALIIAKDESVKTIVAENQLNITEFKKNSNLSKAEAIDYKVQKGDSLYSIAKKHPGITVSDLKKWNKGLEAKELKPGMKLKING